MLIYLLRENWYFESNQSSPIKLIPLVETINPLDQGKKVLKMREVYRSPHYVQSNI